MALNMAMKEDLFEDSDDSADEDYVLKEDNLPSEEEDEGEPEDDVGDENNGKPGRKRKSNQKKGNTRRKRSRKGQPPTVTPVENDDSDDESQEIKEMVEEDEKKKTDSLWFDFLKETESSSLPKSTIHECDSSSKDKGIKNDSRNEVKKGNKVTITKVFEFAGEKVEVTKEVPSDSQEAKKNSAKVQSDGTETNGGGSREETTTLKEVSKPKVGGGLSSLLSQIGKKAKIGTLEKSKIDWDRFKKSENLADDIEVHNRGRDGFLERQDFLQRTDLRQFEKEKQMRAPRRSNR